MDSSSQRRRRKTRGASGIEYVVVVILVAVAGISGYKLLGTKYRCKVGQATGLFALTGDSSTAANCDDGSGGPQASNSPPPQSGGPGSAGPTPGITCVGSSCEGGDNCFVAGTLVMTEDGARPIESITTGTRVLSRDQEGDDVAWKPVVRTFVRRTDQLVELTIGDPDEPETIDVTPSHRIHAKGRGWVDAELLVPGADLLVDAQGRDVKLLGAEELAVSVNVYNMEVEDFHTYYVGEHEFWAHNGCVHYPDLPLGYVCQGCARGPVPLTPLPYPRYPYAQPQVQNPYSQGPTPHSVPSYTVPLPPMVSASSLPNTPYHYPTPLPNTPYNYAPPPPPPPPVDFGMNSNKATGPAINDSVTINGTRYPVNTLPVSSVQGYHGVKPGDIDAVLNRVQRPPGSAGNYNPDWKGFYLTEDPQYAAGYTAGDDGRYKGAVVKFKLPVNAQIVDLGIPASKLSDPATVAALKAKYGIPPNVPLIDGLGMHNPPIVLREPTEDPPEEPNPELIIPWNLAPYGSARPYGSVDKNGYFYR